MPCSGRFTYLSKMRPGYPPLVRVLVFCLLLSAALGVNPSRVTATAQTSDSHAQLLDQVWQTAGLENLGHQVAADILTGVENDSHLHKLRQPRRESVVNQYRRFTTGQRFANRLRDHLRASSPDDLKAMLAMSKSPIAQRALAAELNFRVPSPTQLAQWWSDQPQTAMGKEREIVVTRLDAALGVTDTAVAIAGASLFATRTLLSRRQGLEKNKQFDDKAIKAINHRMRDWQSRQTRLTYLYLYRDLPLIDLRQYVRLLEAEPLRSAQRGLIQTLADEMLAIQRDVVNAILANDKADSGYQT